MTTAKNQGRRLLFLLASLIGLAQVSFAAPDALLKLKEPTEHIPVKVEIRGESGNFQLFRDGKPYQVRGAGIDVASPDAEQMMRELKKRGGNSFRTWNLHDGKFFDLAHELGLTVAACLDVKRERHGFDYDDEAAVQRQLDKFEQQVRRYRNHPALLVWVIGNELNYDYKNPRVYDAVNDISKMIHELDPNHPTTTTTAGIDAGLASVIGKRAPDVDFLSVQVYGGLFTLEGTLRMVRWKKPLMITEWGTVGHWEVAKTDWDAPYEFDSTQKASVYWRGYSEVIQSLGGRLIGDYVFLWGQKQERTPTWYGVFVDGARTPAVDVMQQIWTGAPPPDQAPLIKSLTLDGRKASDDVRLKSGQRYVAEVQAFDPESGGLTYSWQLLEESRATEAGGDREQVPTDHSRYLQAPEGASLTLEAPAEAGPYRLFVYAHDPGGAVAHANIPFLVR